MGLLYRHFAEYGLEFQDMANHPEGHGRVAVLLHLAHHEQWDEIAGYLGNARGHFALLVNLVRGMHTQAELVAQEGRILRRFPGARVTVSPNVGLDIGGTFYLMDLLAAQEPACRYVLKLHTKSNPLWRRHMLARLLGSAERCDQILDAFDRNSKLGMVGSYFFPFDYMNLKYVLEYLNRFGATVNQRWDRYRRLHPDVAGRGLNELIAHSLLHGETAFRPEIDLEFYTAYVGDFREESLQPDESIRRRMRALGVIGKLPYYPGTCFWMRGDLVRALFQKNDAIALAQELEAGWVSDRQRQTRTHAWERVIPILAKAYGYEIAVVPGGLSLTENENKEVRQALAVAVDHHRAGRLVQAEGIYRRILRTIPEHADALHLLGLAAHQNGDHRRALELMHKALRARPAYAEAHCNCAKVYRALGDVQAARRHYETALKLKPLFAEAHNNLGDLLQGEGELVAAIRHYRQALEERETFPQAHNNLGTALRDRGATAEALRHYARALALNPNYLEARCNLGAALQELGKSEEAVACYRSVIEAEPGNPQAQFNLGTLLQERGQIDAAIACYRKALAEWPWSVAAHNNLGTALEQRGDDEAAEACYRRAITLSPDDAEALTNLAGLLHEIGRHDEAIEYYDRVLTLDPQLVTARWGRCVAELRPIYSNPDSVMAARRAYLERLTKLERELDLSSPAVARAAEHVLVARQPFYLPYHDDLEATARETCDAQRRYGRLLTRVMRRRYPDLAVRRGPQPARDRLRIGVVSAFFRRHSNWKIPIRGWVEQLDRARFALYGYHTGAELDICTEQARRACDCFIEHASFAELCHAITGHQLDVLIYPGLGMDPVSTRLAALRLAPVQCASWGHPVTTGLPTIDYFLSSDLMEPPGGEFQYTEALFRLPNLSFYYDPADPPDSAMSRRDLGLPEDELLFLCAQAAPKYHPAHDLLLARIASAINEAAGAARPRFVFLQGLRSARVTEALIGRLTGVFARYGLDAADHLLVLPRQSPAGYAALNALCDLALDTVGWSGCNSTLEAIARDLPVITMHGSTMRSRHSAAILSMMGTTETVADSLDEYVEIAVRLGTEPAAREALRKRISERKHRVYRDRESVRGLEAFLEQVSTEQPRRDS